MSTIHTPSSSELIPLVSLAGELQKIAADGALVPSYGVLKAAGYSGRFQVERSGRQLAVRRAELPAIARFYGLSGALSTAAA